MESILTTVKTHLGLVSDYTPFDNELIAIINGVLMTAGQIGLGPEEGFSISGTKETWEDFIGDRKDIEAVKSYIALKVKLIWDPPQSGYLINAMKEVIVEYEWRLNIQVDPISDNFKDT